ncbi:MULTISPECIES: metallopeptidase family protein [unclassified Arthrobacter]|uniref:metallopeptidase family protein n=1 Tax=Arthrobacter sp. Leaf234 TaxID=1736303 RepID=UPI0006FD5D87|nr:metallopeptidase family protein [Arthrobacter sp. Leaf234]
MQDEPTFSVNLTDPSSAEGRPARSFYERRRNRRGRGMRGTLLPPHLPGSRSRSEQFDDWVMESAQRLERLWGERIHDLQIVVQEIPDGLEEMTADELKDLLGSCTPAAPGRPAVITIYRHPVLMAAKSLMPVNELVHDVVVEQTAELMGLSPEAVDPAYGRSQA